MAPRRCRTHAERGRGVFLGKVASNEALCAAHYLLRVTVPGFPSTRAGQFVQLLCRGTGEQVTARETALPPTGWPKLSQPELADTETMLRRPFSIAWRRDAAGRETELAFIYLSRGTGTRWLCGVKPGAELSILGPLGKPFTVFEDKPLAALVAGGVGIPPMIYLAEALSSAGKRVVAFSGASTEGKLPLTMMEGVEVRSDGVPTTCVKEFAERGVASVVATDDGSLGVAGFVDKPFREWLGRGDVCPDDLAVYCCGPEPLMREIGETSVATGIACELAMERHMACGMGTCQSCVVKVRDAAAPDGWSFALCCTDGPVFDAAKIVWE